MSVSGTQPDSPVGGDGVETVAGSAAPGLTGSTLVASDFGSGHDDSGDLRLDLASVIHEVGCQCRGHKLGWTIRDRDAQQLAAGVLAAGYRRVSVDDDTVERVARSIFAQACARYAGPDALPDWDGDTEASREEFRFVARAAVQALRDGSGT